MQEVVTGALCGTLCLFVSNIPIVSRLLRTRPTYTRPAYRMVMGPLIGGFRRGAGNCDHARSLIYAMVRHGLQIPAGPVLKLSAPSPVTDWSWDLCWVG